MDNSVRRHALQNPQQRTRSDIVEHRERRDPEDRAPVENERAGGSLRVRNELRGRIRSTADDHHPWGYVLVANMIP